MEILIIENQEEVRNRLVFLLERENGYRVVAAVRTTAEALDYLAFHGVGLVIVNVESPGVSAVKTVSALKAVSPEIKILVFSGSDEDERVFPVLKAGAIGYLLEDAHPQQIIAALEEIKAGGSPLSPSIAMKLLRNYQAQPGPEDCISPLSVRETEILALLYRGKELTEIAADLCISLHTVRVHTKNIYHKLNVNSRSHAIYQALCRNLIRP